MYDFHAFVWLLSKYAVILQCYEYWKQNNHEQRN